MLTFFYKVYNVRPQIQTTFLQIYRHMKKEILTICIGLYICILAAIPINVLHSQVKVIEDQPLRSINEILVERNHLPVMQRIEMYHKLKSTYVNKRQLEENMNLYGYTLLWDGKPSEALEIFKLLVTEFPDSPNTYDSLAEVYLQMGNTQLALANYQKAFAMDPSNFNAEDQIEKIKNPNLKDLTPQQKFYSTYTVNEYKEDLDQLGATLLEVHPNALKFITKAEFSNLLAQKKSMITQQTTYAEFAWMCSEVVAYINCSHTSALGFWNMNKMLPQSLRFPLQTRWIAGCLFVIDPLNNADKVSTKDEIESINGIKVKELMAKIYKHIPSQGYIETSKTHEFNTWSTGMLAYALGFPEEYKVKINGSEADIVLRKSEFHNDPKRDESKIHCGGDLCIEYIDKDKKIARMTISSFNYYRWNNFLKFKEFVDEGMIEFARNGTDQLIIDVRDNGGGSPESSIHLLKYLIDEPFVYYSRAEYDGKTEISEGEKLIQPVENGFRGKLYFLIDGKGNSTTGHFMSLVKTKKLGLIIGEELGSNQFCSAGRKRCRLSNTKLLYDVAVNTHVSTATALPDEVGILPDYFVTQSIIEYMEGHDAVKAYTLDLISEELDWTPSSGYHSTYFLEANPRWDKELFQIPIHFAPDIKLRGVEDARFPLGWAHRDSLTFWSYAFAWNVDQSQPLLAAEIESNLILYFDGLMNMEKRSQELNIDMSTASIKEMKSSDGKINYVGQIHTFDGFHDKINMTLNVKAEQYFCDQINRTIILFRFSKQAFDSEVWDILNSVQMPDDICKP